MREDPTPGAFPGLGLGWVAFLDCVNDVLGRMVQPRSRLSCVRTLNTDHGRMRIGGLSPHGAWICPQGAWIVPQGERIGHQGTRIVSQGAWIAHHGAHIVPRKCYRPWLAVIPHPGEQYVRPEGRSVRPEGQSVRPGEQSVRPQRQYVCPESVIRAT